MAAKPAVDQRTKMLETPIPPLICKLAVPTIISMLVTAIYNTADTYFVSQINTSASGAVGIVFSVMAIIQAVGFTVGVGSGSPAHRGKRTWRTSASKSRRPMGTVVGVGLGVGWGV